MVGVNKYFQHSKISEAGFRHLVRCFVLDLTATQTAVIAGISVPIREHDFSENAKEDGRSLGAQLAIPRRSRGRRVVLWPASRARQKRPRSRRQDDRLRPAQRGNEVYTEIVPNASKVALQAVIRG
jgi:hypothetical protein